MFVSLLRFIPLLANVLLTTMRFFPRVRHGYLGLALRLPCSRGGVIVTVLTFKMLTLFAYFTADFVVVKICLPRRFADRLMRHVLLSTTP